MPNQIDKKIEFYDKFLAFSREILDKHRSILDRVRRKDIDFSTTIGGDLGIDGDDAIEIIKEFEIAIGWKLRNFPIERYFGPEYPLTFSTLILAISGKKTSLDKISVQRLADYFWQSRPENEKL